MLLLYSNKWKVLDISKTVEYIALYLYTLHFADYGIPYTQLDKVKKGPKFELQPVDLAVISRALFVTIETVAVGYPQPSYEWKRFRGSNTTINSLANAETVSSFFLLPNQYKRLNKWCNKSDFFSSKCFVCALTDNLDVEFPLHADQW